MTVNRDYIKVKRRHILQFIGKDIDTIISELIEIKNQKGNLSLRTPFYMGHNCCELDHSLYVEYEETETEKEHGSRVAKEEYYEELERQRAIEQEKREREFLRKLKKKYPDD